MHTAPPESLTTDVRPAMTAHLSEGDLERLFPVDFKDLDSLAAAEPSRAALLRLDAGSLVVVEYGTVTSTLTISVPRDADVGETLVELLEEVPFTPSSIEWLAKEVRVLANGKLSMS